MPECEAIERRAQSLDCEDVCKETIDRYKNAVETGLFEDNTDNARIARSMLNNELVDLKFFLASVKKLRAGRKLCAMGGGAHINDLEERLKEQGYECVERFGGGSYGIEKEEDGIKKRIYFINPVMPSQIRNLGKWPVIVHPHANKSSVYFSPLAHTLSKRTLFGNSKPLLSYKRD